MFTDIAGFTRQSEAMSARRDRRFPQRSLRHAGRLCEAEGGTIDKFIGDAVMAFWGAPQAVPDHAARACRAALAMRTALAADNARRRAEGAAPVRVRIGLHTGAGHRRQYRRARADQLHDRGRHGERGQQARAARQGAGTGRNGRGDRAQRRDRGGGGGRHLPHRRRHAAAPRSRTGNRALPAVSATPPARGSRTALPRTARRPGADPNRAGRPRRSRRSARRQAWSRPRPSLPAA